MAKKTLRIITTPWGGGNYQQLGSCNRRRGIHHWS